MARTVVIFASIAVVLVPRAARAAGPVRARIDYRVAPGVAGCPAAAALKDEVRARLPAVRFDGGAGGREVRVSVGRGAGERLEARVALVGPGGRSRGERVLRAPRARCGELLEALALAISIALDPTAALVERPPPRPRAERRDRWRVALWAGGLVAAGEAPGVQGGARLGVDLRWRWLRISVSGRVALPASGTVASGGSVGAWLVGGGAAGCGAWRAFFGCVTASLAAYRASGDDLPGARSATALLPAVGLRAGVQLPLFGPLWVRVAGEARALLRRPRLLDGGGGPLWEASPVAGGATMDLVVALF